MRSLEIIFKQYNELPFGLCVDAWFGKFMFIPKTCPASPSPACCTSGFERAAFIRPPSGSLFGLLLLLLLFCCPWLARPPKMDPRSSLTEKIQIIGALHWCEFPCSSKDIIT